MMRITFGLRSAALAGIAPDENTASNENNATRTIGTQRMGNFGDCGGVKRAAGAARLKKRPLPSSAATNSCEPLITSRHLARRWHNAGRRGSVAFTLRSPLSPLAERTHARQRLLTRHMSGHRDWAPSSEEHRPLTYW